MGDVLTERQDLIASSLGLGLLLSAVGAAIVGSLVAVGLTSLTNVRVRYNIFQAEVTKSCQMIFREHGHYFSFHADEVGTISFPYLTLALKGDDVSTEEHIYDELDEDTLNLVEISKSDLESLNMNDTHESFDSNFESHRGKGKNSFMWTKSTKYIKTP